MNKKLIITLVMVMAALCSRGQYKTTGIGTIIKGFLSPPDSAKPGVYWYFMDGNMTKASMTADLESMKKAGIGNLIFLEVNVDVPVGPVDFLSDQWQDLFKHAVREGERLGIEITLGVGPGWTGSGGPWVPAGQSMQHLVSSTVTVNSAESTTITLPLPEPKKPYFGEGAFTPGIKKSLAGLLYRCSSFSLSGAHSSSKN